MNTELTNVSILFRFFLIMCYTKASYVVFNLYTHEGLLEECNLWTNNKHIKKKWRTSQLRLQQSIVHLKHFPFPLKKLLSFRKKLQPINYDDILP